MSSTSAMDPAEHPIEVVARRTGLTQDVIRVWERRYRAVTPERSPGGRRLYTNAQIARLALLRRAIDGGRSISEVVGRSDRELEQLVASDVEAGTPKPRTAASRDRSNELAAALDAVEALDEGRLRAELTRAAVELGRDPFLEVVLIPLLREVGRRWHEGSMRVCHEHLATATSRSVLESLLHSSRGPASGPDIVVAALAGQRHELGAMIVALSAAAERWRVTYLGTDLPPEELALAVAQRRAGVVALSLVFPHGDPAVEEQIRALRRAIGPRVVVLAGGPAVPSYAAVLEEIGARRLGDLADLQAELARLGSGHRSLAP